MPIGDEQYMSAEELPLDLDVLVTWMDEQSLESGPLEDAKLLIGGTQNILLRFRRGKRDFILRRPPLHLRKNSNKTMMREARLLQALAGSNVPHPGFIASCEDDDVLGACFYLMEPVEGFNPANGLPNLHATDPALRRRMGFSYIEGLAALGSVNHKAVGLEDFGKPEGFLERQPARWMGQLEGYSSFKNWTGLSALPDVEPIVGWLERQLPTDFEPGIIHGDCHLANTMFDPKSPEMVALVDWELTTIGDPLIDLGWVVATWPSQDQTSAFTIEPRDGFPALDDLITHYAERSSRNIDAVSWYGVLGCFKLGAILEGTHARASVGKAPKETGDFLHEITISLFERAHRLIAEN